MARNIESDATYCSEIEKEEDQYKIRRSKRLSQRNFLSNFRSKGDPIQRLYEIYQALKCAEVSSKWSFNEWESLKDEVESIQKIIKGKQKGRIAFILKNINRNLQNSSSICPTHSENVEQVKSPNILAGMTTEILTEIPPYQRGITPEIVNDDKMTGSAIALTQKNPLDLTKKTGEMQVGPPVVLNLNSPEKQKQQPTETIMPKRIAPFEHKYPKTKTNFSVSKDSMIDLTTEHEINTNRKNRSPVIKERTTKPKSPIRVSKWFQFLSTQERPKIPEKPPRVTTASAPKKSSNSLKESIAKLYRDQTAATSVSNAIPKTLTIRNLKKPTFIQKRCSSPITPHSNLNFKHRSFQNTSIENKIPRDHELPRRLVQSENLRNISPDFLLDEFLDFDEPDMNDSGTSLTPSLKEGFKKIFGTDKLSDVFGADEVVYELKENHIRRLAMTLKVDLTTLKKTIENILANDNCEALEDDSMRSDSSVIECSQSPPQRLFPSQRSQP